MEKKQIILFLFECLICAVWVFLAGFISEKSLFFGDLNLIDEGQFASWANQMLHGKLMYRDMYITFGPLMAYPPYLLFKLFGPSAFLIRFYTLFIGSFLGLVSGILVMRVLRFSLFLQIVTLGLLMIVPGIGFRQWSGLLVIVAAFYAIDKRNLVLSSIVGASTAAVFLMSPEIGILTSCLVIFNFIILFISAKKITIALRIVFASLFGFTTVVLLFFIWSNGEGWFLSYIWVSKDVLKTFSGIDLPNGQGLPHPFALMPKGLNLYIWLKYIVSQKFLLFWTLFGYLCILFTLFVRIVLFLAKKEEFLIGSICLFGLLLYVSLIGRSGHYSIVIAPFILCCAYYLRRIFPLAKKAGSRGFSVLVVGFFLLYILRHIALYRNQFFPTSSVSSLVFEKRPNPQRVEYIALSAVQRNDIQTLQAFIAHNTSDRDEIFFLSDIPMMYMLVDRLNPTRYDLPYIADTKEKRYEILDSLIRKPPKYIIEDRQAWAVDGVSNRQRLPEIVVFIKQKYQLKAELNHFFIYEKRG